MFGWGDGKLFRREFRKSTFEVFAENFWMSLDPLRTGRVTFGGSFGRTFQSLLPLTRDQSSVL